MKIVNAPADVLSTPVKPVTEFDNKLKDIAKAVNRSQAETFLQRLNQEVAKRSTNRLGVGQFSNFKDLKAEEIAAITKGIGLKVSTLHENPIVLFDINLGELPENAWQRHTTYLSCVLSLAL